MAMSFSPLAVAILLLSTIAPISLISCTTSIPNSSNNSIQSFLQCFLNNMTNNTTTTFPSPQQLPILHASDGTSYQSILQSSSQNLRFLVSKANRKPAAIVTPTLESHVSLSVTCARKYGLNLRTRSGGHDYEAMSYVSVGDTPFVVVDLSALDSVEVDLARRTAWVQGGTTLGKVYHTIFTSSNGKFGFPAGICPTVGVGGHISGGGLGTMSRKFGMAADNVVDARVVNVDGRVLDRTAMGEDLFWPIRGGGAASFGVVVAYKLRLVEVPPVVTVFNVKRNLNQNATKLVTRWQEIAPNFDKNLFIRVVAQTEPDGGSQGNINIQARFNSVYFGSRSELFSVMAKSFPELGLRDEDCTEMSWLHSLLFFNGMPTNQGLEALLSRKPQFNSSFKAKSDYVTKPIAERDWDRIWKFLMESRDEPLVMILEPYGGRMSEVSEAATPFPHRKGNLYNVQYFMRWFETDVAVTQKHLDWMRKLYDFMTPYVSSNPRGAYYNYKDIDLGPASTRSSSFSEARVWGEKYFMSNFRRLASVKGRVDPQNFFRNEQSIPPLL